MRLFEEQLTLSDWPFLIMTPLKLLRSGELQQVVALAIRPGRLDSLGDKPLQAAERELITRALQRSGGNKKRAAQSLGISRFALQRRLDKLALDLLGNGRKCKIS